MDLPHTKAHNTDNQQITETLMEDPHFQAGVWHNTFQNSLTLKRLQITPCQIPSADLPPIQPDGPSTHKSTSR